MIQTQQFPSNLFLFNPQHDSFIRGDVRVLPTVMTPQQAIRYFATLFLLIALPASLIITLLISLTGRHIFLLLPIELLAAILACAFVTMMGYWHDHALMRSGKIVIGEIIDADSRPVIGTPSQRTITRLKYRFATPDNQAITKTISLEHIRQHLPDGRRYPEVGTKIAVLYADSRHQMLL